ncbi:hypothetical protein Ae406Ps2_3340c [Pseudonocardia sp. Ae406_Ps2]|nr:hypothetical protein Ae331Ps2_2584 [Pseudonocardia sp. Ae331_Ps2]OLM03340.1 hypothetical protein Ae406Ps2_3340c [Pseudonocardia sp. Ae406_Ps2]OLM11764.1 hypothetical protein Ae505Ps2_1889 [Pseudonocardia sp. Ae505_Ps2]OLM24905.1 hypothetical protein Ae706Ps2_3338c [Pseudonocardia sp. Ae706_Ps2]
MQVAEQGRAHNPDRDRRPCVVVHPPGGRRRSPCAAEPVHIGEGVAHIMFRVYEGATDPGRARGVSEEKRRLP